MNAALQWILMATLTLYLLTHFDDFRYINIKPAVKITSRSIIDGWTTQGDGDITAPHYTVPRPTYQSSVNSPGTGFGKSGRYVGGPPRENILDSAIDPQIWMDVGCILSTSNNSFCLIRFVAGLGNWFEITLLLTIFWFLNVFICCACIGLPTSQGPCSIAEITRSRPTLIFTAVTFCRIFHNVSFQFAVHVVIM